MQSEKKSEIQRYFDSLAYTLTDPAPQPAPAPSATPRRDRYAARLIPLHERLRVALAKFPREMVADGLHLDQVWGLVLGRQREKPRAFEVANALRTLGFQRVRLYSDGTSPSQSLWFPPDIDPADAKAAMKARKA